LKIFDQLRAINGAFFGVLRAEFDALSNDLTAAGKRVLTGLLLVLITLGVAAVLLAVLVFVAIAVLSLWLPWWGAGLVVAGVLALGAALCWMAAMSKLRGETPVAIVNRHVKDHLEWWQDRVASDAPPARAPGASPAPAFPDEELP
jgi:hypothetical protein